MTLKGDAIFKEKLTGGLKNDIRYCVNFHGNRRKSEKLRIYGLLLSIAYKISAKKKGTEVLSLMTGMSNTNFPEKRAVCLENNTRNSVSFNCTSGQSGNLDYDRLLLSKVRNV